MYQGEHLHTSNYPPACNPSQNVITNNLKISIRYSDVHDRVPGTFTKSKSSYLFVYINRFESTLYDVETVGFDDGKVFNRK